MLKVGSTALKLVMKWVAALGVLGAVTYPIIIYPMMDPKKYKEIQKVTRKDVDQSKVQPGNMKIWSDPFDRK